MNLLRGETADLNRGHHIQEVQDDSGKEKWHQMIVGADGTRQVECY